jgi:hypothetical protein
MKFDHNQRSSGFNYDSQVSMNSGSPFKQNNLIKKPNSKKLKPEELIELSLNEIFYFYSR